MIWAHLDLNRNFKLDSEPREWPFALAALGLSGDHMAGYLAFLDHNRDGAISLQVCTESSYDDMYAFSWNVSSQVLPSRGYEGMYYVPVNLDDLGMACQEWKAHGYQHPPLKIKVETTLGFTQYFEIQSADFGLDFRHTPGMTYSGQIVYSDPEDGCHPLKTHDYTDKIVLIRASHHCHFCKAAVYAQIAKAAGVIIESLDDHLIYMPPQSCGEYVHLATIMVTKTTGERFRTAAYANAILSFPVCPEWNGLAPGFGMEQCDDNNTVPGDGCDHQCLWECGNAVVAPPEECDDQNRINGDGCSMHCLIERFEPPTVPLNPRVVASGIERFFVTWETPAEGKPTGG